MGFLQNVPAWPEVGRRAVTKRDFSLGVDLVQITRNVRRGSSILQAGVGYPTRSLPLEAGTEISSRLTIPCPTTQATRSTFRSPVVEPISTR
jgi:hypothetical protein